MCSITRRFSICWRGNWRRHASTRPRPRHKYRCWIRRCVPRVRSWPKPFLFILIGLVVGTMLGCIRVAVIYVYDYAETDPRLRDRYLQVKQALHLRG